MDKEQRLLKRQRECKPSISQGPGEPRQPLRSQHQGVPEKGWQGYTDAWERYLSQTHQSIIHTSLAPFTRELQSALQRGMEQGLTTLLWGVCSHEPYL